MFEEDFTTRGVQTDRPESYQHLKAQPSIRRHIWIFSPSNGISKIGKVSPSNGSMFFLWELKSEAQTLTLIIYQSTFSFGPFSLLPWGFFFFFPDPSGAEAHSYCHSLSPSSAFFFLLRFLFLHPLAGQLFIFRVGSRAVGGATPLESCALHFLTVEVWRTPTF